MFLFHERSRGQTWVIDPVIVVYALGAPPGDRYLHPFFAVPKMEQRLSADGDILCAYCSKF